MSEPDPVAELRDAACKAGLTSVLECQPLGTSMFQGECGQAALMPRLTPVLGRELERVFQAEIAMVHWYLTPSRHRSAQDSDIACAERCAARARRIRTGLAEAGWPAPEPAVNGELYDFEAALRQVQWPDPRTT